MPSEFFVPGAFIGIVGLFIFMMSIVAPKPGEKLIRYLKILAGAVITITGLWIVNQASGTGQREIAEFQAIRQEIASAGLSEQEKVYFMKKLDPQSGFLGMKSDVTIQEARDVVHEARVAVQAKTAQVAK